MSLEDSLFTVTFARRRSQESWKPYVVKRGKSKGALRERNTLTGSTRDLTPEEQGGPPRHLLEPHWQVADRQDYPADEHVTPLVSQLARQALGLDDRPDPLAAAALADHLEEIGSDARRLIKRLRLTSYYKNQSLVKGLRLIALADVPLRSDISSGGYRSYRAALAANRSSWDGWLNNTRRFDASLIKHKYAENGDKTLLEQAHAHLSAPHVHDLIDKSEDASLRDDHDAVGTYDRVRAMLEEGKGYVRARQVDDLRLIPPTLPLTPGVSHYGTGHASQPGEILYVIGGDGQFDTWRDHPLSPDEVIALARSKRATFGGSKTRKRRKP